MAPGTPSRGKGCQSRGEKFPPSNLAARRASSEASAAVAGAAFPGGIRSDSHGATSANGTADAALALDPAATYVLTKVHQPNPAKHYRILDPGFEDGNRRRVGVEGLFEQIRGVNTAGGAVFDARQEAKSDPRIAFGAENLQVEHHVLEVIEEGAVEMGERRRVAVGDHGPSIPSDFGQDGGVIKGTFS